MLVYRGKKLLTTILFRFHKLLSRYEININIQTQIKNFFEQNQLLSNLGRCFFL